MEFPLRLISLSPMFKTLYCVVNSLTLGCTETDDVHLLAALSSHVIAARLRRS